MDKALYIPSFLFYNVIIKISTGLSGKNSSEIAILFLED